MTNDVAYRRVLEDRARAQKERERPGRERRKQLYQRRRELHQRRQQRRLVEEYLGCALFPIINQQEI